MLERSPSLLQTILSSYMTHLHGEKAAKKLCMLREGVRGEEEEKLEETKLHLLLFGIFNSRKAGGEGADHKRVRREAR